MPPPSSLETFLGRNNISFLVAFFRCWDPSTIFLLGQLNYRLRCLVKLYEFNVWNVEFFLARWFLSPKRALQTIQLAPAIFCGSSVLSFFDRTPLGIQKNAKLDICVGFRGVTQIGKFLLSQGYNFRPGQALRITDFNLAVLAEAGRLSKNDRVDGDRSLTQEEHGSVRFKFQSPRPTYNGAVIVVHLVRCELHRFVFSMHSSMLSRIFGQTQLNDRHSIAGLMNYITGTHAISTFPKSTFVKRKSFVACQERTGTTSTFIRHDERWLEKYTSTSGQLAVIGTHTKFDGDAEIGARRIGDERCWIIPVSLVLGK